MSQFENYQLQYRKINKMIQYAIKFILLLNFVEVKKNSQIIGQTFYLFLINKVIWTKILFDNSKIIARLLLSYILSY